MYSIIHKKNKNTGGNKLLTDTNNLPEYVFTGKKFLRRKDITENIRAHIAVTGFMAMQNSNHGIITNLARQFNVSRPFVYDAIDSLTAVFPFIFNTPSPKFDSIAKEQALSHILSLTGTLYR